MTLWLFKDRSQTISIVRVSSTDPAPLGLVAGKRKTTVSIPSGAPLATVLSLMGTMSQKLSGIAGEETFIEVSMTPVNPT